MKKTLTLLVCIMQFTFVYCACPSEVHRDIKGFGLGCRYRCNCKNNEQCNEVTGDCSNGCLQGWMGPGCQYRNIAAMAKSQELLQNPPQYDPEYNSTNAVDLNETTCSQTGLGPGRRWLRISISASMYVVGFIIQLPEDHHSEFRGSFIEVSNTTDTWSLCYRDNTSLEQNATLLEVLCVKPLVGQYIRISLAEDETRNLTLCEVEIYGGRLVSFRQPTSMDSTYNLSESGPWNSSYGVDGRVALPGENQGVDSERTCASTDDDYVNLKDRWWMLDLGTVYNIQAVSFFGRHEVAYQFYGFVIERSEGGSIYYQLFTDPKRNYITAPYHPISANFTWPSNGQYIKVNLYKAAVLTVCELEVFADCPHGKCGWDCSETCMCSSQTTGTHKILGTCPHGCRGRWTGLDYQCNKECANNSWGPLCNMVCGNCVEPCDVVAGTCPGSCHPGYLPPYCTQETTESYLSVTDLIIGVAVGILLLMIAINVNIIILFKRRSACRCREETVIKEDKAINTDSLDMTTTSIYTNYFVSEELSGSSSPEYMNLGLQKSCSRL